MKHRKTSNYGFTIFLLMLVTSLNAQVVSFSQEQISLEALFDTLTNKTSIDIAYDVNSIPTDSIISADFYHQHALAIVQHVLKSEDVDIVYVDGQIVIRKMLNDQDNLQSHIIIQGTVMDADEMIALPLVNISVKGRPLGTISNADGQYEFKVPLFYQGEVMVFSFLGYQSLEMTIPERDTLADVQLMSSTVKLNEVQVAYKDPDEILSELYASYAANYFDEQAVLSGFFRESIKQDDAYVQVSEAIVEIVKPSYLNPSSMERVRFIKGRKKNDLQAMDLIDFKLEGGPFQFSRVDIARYKDFFHEENSQYKYAYGGIDILDDEIVYKVLFKPVSDDGDHLYKGTMYINAESFALVRSEFELTKKALRSSGRTLIKKASRKVKAKPLKASYYIDYRPFNGKWILNRIDGKIVIHINDRRKKVNSVFTAVSELLISDWEARDKVKLKPSELYKSNYVLSEQITETDADFWEDYNIIRPDEALEKVFKKTKVVSK